MTSSSSKLSITKKQSENHFSNTKKSNLTRSHSSYLTKECNPWEYYLYFNERNLTPSLTKSHLVYQLIRSTLRNNLATSLPINRHTTIDKQDILPFSNP